MHVEVEVGAARLAGCPACARARHARSVRAGAGTRTGGHAVVRGRKVGGAGATDSPTAVTLVSTVSGLSVDQTVTSTGLVSLSALHTANGTIAVTAAVSGDAITVSGCAVERRGAILMRDSAEFRWRRSSR